ncbi:exonuclease SbcCD subunit D [Dankookia rubra]|uniref:Nuclease SbcCD subunit D n=1 Tax=Dankookia rubra TaxID=1442381 RepID=A0A4R5QJA1_9PROT|nr:exonuclease SbcCD subunit D [Dankookia rubra]TDH63236.1 exonuclease SbcCD subunit D [Dankookia rubra]
MRLLHTADWHLGRTLGGHSLRAEQEHLLGEEFPRLVADAAPDAVLIAGDIFDRAVPPAEAVELLDDILHRIVIGLRIPVVMIPGNHDEARRLSFGARMLSAAGLHIGDSPLGRVVTLRDAHGPVAIVAAGYATPLGLAQHAGAGDFADHDAGFAWLAPQLHTLCGDTARRVLVAHAFVAGGAVCDSERGISVGGTGQIAAARFAGFHYVALGHLHRPQALLNGRLRYSGSPLAYSTSEAGQAKQMLLVEIDAAGGVATEAIALAPLRGLRLLHGEFAALRAATEGRDDFVAITLTDAQPIPDAQRALAELYPRIIGFGYAEQPRQPGPLVAPDGAARALRPFDLFGEFHAAMRGAPLPAEAHAVVAAAIAEAEAAIA